MDIKKLVAGKIAASDVAAKTIGDTALNFVTMRMVLTALINGAYEDFTTLTDEAKERLQEDSDRLERIIGIYNEMIGNLRDEGLME